MVAVDSRVRCAVKDQSRRRIGSDVGHWRSLFPEGRKLFSGLLEEAMPFEFFGWSSVFGGDLAGEKIGDSIHIHTGFDFVRNIGVGLRRAEFRMVGSVSDHES